MKIALISTTYIIPTPPPNFGGMERINYWIGQELVKRGHEVVLFGCKGSYLDGAHVVELPGGGEVHPAEGGPYPPYFEFMKDWVFSHEPMDIFHDSTHHHEFSRRLNGIPVLATIHNPNPIESRNSVFISDSHRRYLGYSTSPYVMNGAPEGEYPYVSEKEDYVLFMGALGTHKGFDIAIRFALDYGIPLKIAGHPMGDTEADILQKACTYPNIEYLGVIGEPLKSEVLSKASAVLMPFRWSEPGCILAVEAMACGTPIIASNAGVLPEYVVDRRTGFLGCTDPESIYEAYRSLKDLDNEHSYQRFIERFTIGRVVDEYEQLYQRASNGEIWNSP